MYIFIYIYNTHTIGVVCVEGGIEIFRALTAAATPSALTVSQRGEDKHTNTHTHMHAHNATISNATNTNATTGVVNEGGDEGVGEGGGGDMICEWELHVGTTTEELVPSVDAVEGQVSHQISVEDAGAHGEERKKVADLIGGGETPSRSGGDRAHAGAQELCMDADKKGGEGVNTTARKDATTEERDVRFFVGQRPVSIGGGEQNDSDCHEGVQHVWVGPQSLPGVLEILGASRSGSRRARVSGSSGRGRNA